VILNTVSTYT